MKLAAMYSVFNGMELLMGSIEQIYDKVDLLIICYQNVSNQGNPASESMNQMLSLITTNPKIHLIEYRPDLAIGTKENERRKYQLRLELAKGLECTHYFTSATDHYYMPGEFEVAKYRAKQLDVDVTLTMMYTYYKHPTWQLTPIEDYAMPFICKLYPETTVVTENHYPITVDPAVRISPANSFHTFPQDEIMMHHFSMVRNDIQDKFDNAAASVNWKHKIQGFVDEYNEYTLESNVGVSYFKGRKIKEVPNYFGIKI